MYQSECDPEMVETLIRAATSGMSKVAVPEITTHEELLTATFTLLDRTLRSVRRLQSNEERFNTADQVRKALEEMIVDHGHVPS